MINACKLLVLADLEPSEYKLIKFEHEKKLIGLESKLEGLTAECSNVEPLLNKALKTLAHLDDLYVNADNETKRSLIGALFPEK